MNAPVITVVIIATNEEKQIDAAVRSGLLLGPVLVVDGGSTDATVRIAASLGATTIVNPWPGFVAQRRFAIEQVRSEWMFFLDSDEEITEELAEEIRSLALDCEGYLVPRRSRFLGRWMKHGAWGRDRVLRLFRTSAGKLEDRAVHEEVKVAGRVGTLTNHLMHWSQDDFAAVGRKFTDYVPLMAAEIVRRGRRPSFLGIVARAKLAFFRDYILRLGFLDGWQGFVLAFWGMASVIAKYSEARRLMK